MDENAEIAQTEVFGPVLTVVKFDGGEDGFREYLQAKTIASPAGD